MASGSFAGTLTVAQVNIFLPMREDASRTIARLEILLQPYIVGRCADALAQALWRGEWNERRTR